MDRPWKPGKLVAPLQPPPPAAAPAPPCPAPEPDPPFSAAEQIPVATTKLDLLGPGTLATAVVAPKEGPIPVAAGTPVVTLAKHLRDSASFKKAVRAVSLAWAAFWGYVVVVVLLAGGPFKLDSAKWIGLLKDATYPALATAAAVYGIKVKVGDNDPVVSGSLKGSEKADEAAKEG